MSFRSSDVINAASAQGSIRPLVAVIGGGVAGSTVAMRLGQLGSVYVALMEKGHSLVNGPPICHLHAGGNLYREIVETQCLTLLRESIETLKFYPHVANVRPTVIAVPTRDDGNPLALLPRLQKLQTAYGDLVKQDPANERLGVPRDYYHVFDRNTMRKLRSRSPPGNARSAEDWMIPLARALDFETVQWPLVLVQEYGLSLFRLAASAELTLEQFPCVEVMLNTTLTDVSPCGAGWTLRYCRGGREHMMKVDYLVNACGYQTGELDDRVGESCERLVEFKAAYLARWPGGREGQWPEVIFHGQRGTPEGMAQLTPYGNGLFQLHGMTEEITLFKQGLVASGEGTAQPRLASCFERQLRRGWEPEMLAERNRNAIAHIGHFLPAFKSAVSGGKPLFGAQQIPGRDPALRVTDVAFGRRRYARAEIVKASSALTAANAIVEALGREGWQQAAEPPRFHPPGREAVVARAVELARLRYYPIDLATPTG